MDESPILVDQRAGFRIVTLNRPQRLNAFNETMHRALKTALEEAEADSACRALLLTGAGRAFCAGQDLSDRLASGDQRPDLGASTDAYYNPLVRKLRALPFPVVAAVNGVAAGAGANIALACDIVLAARSASFVQAFAKIGLVPDSGGTWVLPRLVGAARARGLALLAEPLAGGEGRKLGPDLESGGRRRADRRSGKTVRAFCRRPDRRPIAHQTRARCRRNEHARSAARPRARLAARGRPHARLCRGRARLHGETPAGLYRPQAIAGRAATSPRRRAGNLRNSRQIRHHPEESRPRIR